MLPNDDADVLILGAGAAGLAAAQVLVDAQLNVLMLEARDRVGGRIWTVHDERSPLPLELGAEFVHGKAPATMKVIEAARLPWMELAGDRWCSEKGKLGVCQDFFEELEAVFKKMSLGEKDRSFLEFLNAEARDVREEVRRHALRYIEGFEAAHPERISVQALVRENKKSEEIEGDRAFRITSGYDSLLQTMMAEMDADRCRIQMSSAARAVKWSEGPVEVETEDETFRAARCVITLPLGVLQSGGVQFSPPLSAKKEALARLEMGPVLRVTLQFRERFWEGIYADGRSIGDVSFLLSDRPVFPTWWSTMPKRTPLLTGWSAGPSGEQWKGKADDEVVECGVRSLAALLGVSFKEVQDQVVAAHFHNWQADPFSRGAYSYARVGGLDAARDLASPLNQTLFFAGEATNFDGRNGTVDGAIESGRRAAGEMLRTL